ncbi:5-oxoprolinase subunit PxpB [Desulfatirhabdium butyrativorans]|uniref:5-oxoprolinase subunit PxpB n=1 Tax=Desulfatirhabdium butyrativorans TaxID=340467 RepID=UPI000403E9B0|nr:5-oxoprolinase subunit PxpB [Desulfatirhabdium butyrativorans]
MPDYPRFRLCGDTGLLIEFGDNIDPHTHQRLMRLYHALKTPAIQGILDLVPSYASLLVHFDPWQISYERLLLCMDDCMKENRETVDSAPSRIVEIPVHYGGSSGPDMEEVCRYHRMHPEEVIALHSAPVYTVYMIGFTPGFPYLGGLDERLFTPRKQTPRKIVPAGSVGLADKQTGIYSIDSPGGWQLIGRTPLRLFDPDTEPPFLLEPGDRIRFIPLSTEDGAADDPYS